MSIVWRQRSTRHYRRYVDERRFPYLVEWGNTRLTVPAKLRTYLGARIVALLWIVAGRRGVFIVSRKPSDRRSDG